jgi:hypothetical protein
MVKRREWDCGPRRCQILGPCRNHHHGDRKKGERTQPHAFSEPGSERLCGRGSLQNYKSQRPLGLTI